MKPSKDRNLNFLDVMILVAATAVGNWSVPPELQDSLGLVIHDGEVKHTVFWLLAGFVPTCLAWTIAVLAIRLRSPRPNLARLCRQPGFMAGVAALTVASVVIGFTLITVARRGGSLSPTFRASTIVRLPDYVAPAVAGAWLTLAVSRRWRPDPGPIDRLGRGLGVSWVAFLVALLISASLS